MSALYQKRSFAQMQQCSNAGIKVSRFLVFAVYVGDVNANAPVGGVPIITREEHP